MNKITQLLKENPATRNIYQFLKKIRDDYREKMKFDYTGKFFDRSIGSEYLCIILAGYKEFSYEAVFGRIERYQKIGMDVCVISSGKYSDILNNLCEKNQWSYLSTDQNNVCLVQNVAILKHPKARYIFKLDEDVFITENYFDKMLQAYNHAKQGYYDVGVLAPMLNINGYSSARILEKLNLIPTYERYFGTFKYATGPSTQFESNPAFAKYMWGSTGEIPGIDELNQCFEDTILCENPCPYRFSIGAILFERSLWEDMGYFKVQKNSTGMGIDEEQLDTYCYLFSRPLLVSENIVVGHLSFGKQNEEMKQYYLENIEKFI